MTPAAALAATARHEGPLPPLPDWDRGIEALRAAFPLSPFELDLVVLSVLPEVHEHWGDLFARLGSSWRRPTLGIALKVLVPDPGQRARVAPSLPSGAAFRAGLLRMGMPELPRPDQPLAPSAPTLGALLGHLPEALAGTGPVRAMDPADGALLLACRPSLARVVRRLDGASIVQIGRAGPSGAADLARALASHRGCGLVRVQDAGSGAAPLQDVTALAALERAVVLVEGSSDVRRWGVDAEPRRGTLVLAPPADARVEAPASVRLRVADVPPPTPLEAADLWRGLAPELGDCAELDTLANQTRLPLEAMRRAAEAARSTGPLTLATLQEAVHTGQPDPPSSLARVTRPSVPWEALVLPDDVQGQLAELRARVVHRITVQYRWGLADLTGRGDGVVALLHGDSGVGKTFACEALASALHLPLVKVDLSRVVSKWIGETEKNLESVFAMAEGFGRVLMFDEADAVFGKRTGVRDAHDRYANIETNYLLQRLEAFEGLAVLSTNLLKNIDEAFLRRLHLVVHLPRPTIPLRRRLWERSLPAGVTGADVDVDVLARRFDLVGGEIRNAAVRGAYAAAADGGVLNLARLHEAIRAELAKKGRPFPEER